MSIDIKRDILPTSAPNVPNRSMKPKYITVHNTANSSKGADAKMHARYQHNGSGGRKASWHYTVDDTEIWQTLEDNRQGWHAGDGGGAGNTQSIGIEVCENSDGNFDKAVANAQGLIRHLMHKHGIPIGNVVTHKHWSGKNCPHKLIGTWDEFKRGISGEEKAEAPASKPSKKPTPTKPSKPSYKANLAVDGKWGEGTTKALQKALGTPYDGILSGQLRNNVTESLYGNTARFGGGGSVVIRALQRKLGVKADGLLGPATVRALQKRLGTVQDGKLSRPSLAVKEMQRRLNAGTFLK